MKMTMAVMMMMMILTINPRPPSSPLSDGLLLKVDRFLRDPAFETHFFFKSVSSATKFYVHVLCLCYVIILRNLSASPKAKAQTPSQSSLSLNSGCLLGGGSRWDRGALTQFGETHFVFVFLN